jgi:CheY-like chemotaxis protein
MESEDLLDGSREGAHFCTKCEEYTKKVGTLEVCGQCGEAHWGKPEVKKRVLLVDDSEIVRRKIGAIVQKLGCRLFEAADGFEALVQIRENPPDLIILDIIMPRMNGHQVLKELRKDAQFASTPIIMLTAAAGVSEVSAAISNGATDYIRKDIPVTQIIKRLRTHVEA